MSDGFPQGEVDDQVDPKRRQWRLPITINRGSGPKPGQGTFVSLRVLGIAAVVVVLLGAVFLFFQRNGLTGGDTVGPAPVEQNELTLTDAQTIYGTLAPWQESTIVDGVELPAAQDTILWLGDDGSIQESTNRASSVEWRAARPPFVTNLSTSGDLAVITINQRFDYTFYGFQPFVYESQPNTAYRINPETGDVEATDIDNLLSGIADS